MIDVGGISIDLTNTEGSTVRDNSVTAGLDVLEHASADSQVGIRIASRQLVDGAGLEIFDATVLDNNGTSGPFQRAAVELQALDQNATNAWLKNVTIRDSFITDSGGVTGPPLRGIYINAGGAHGLIENVDINTTTVDGASDGFDFAQTAGGAMHDIVVSKNQIQNSIGLSIRRTR